MDKPLRIKKQLDNGREDTALPFATNDWLPAKPDRQILVTGANDFFAAGRTDQVVGEILKNDARAFLKGSDDSVSLNSPCIVELNPSGPHILAYDSGNFDLVICAFLSASIEIRSETIREIGRVLRPGGHLLIIDNLVPGSRLRGKKARQMRQAGEYVNVWMRLRNPRHKKYLDQDGWIDLLDDSKASIQQLAECKIAQGFDTWAGYYSPSSNNRLRLKAMLVQAPEKVRDFLTPVESGDRIAFRMTEVFILAQMARGAD
jgi:SAM-dependent methyltransferase